MNISPVGFSGTTASTSFGKSAATSFEEKIKKPQAYAQPQEPAAASSIKKSGDKKHSVGKKIAGVLVTTAAVAGGLAAGNHFGVFNKLVAKGGKLASVGNALNTAGSFIIDKCAFLKDKIVDLLPKAKEHVDEVV